MSEKIERSLEMASEENIDIQKYLFKILTNWYWFAIFLLVGGSIAYFVNRYSDPVYSVSSSVLVRDKSNSYNSGIESIVREMNLFSRVNRKNVENEKGVISSYTLIRRTIGKLDFKISYFGIGRIRQPEIYRDTPFIVKLDTSLENKEALPIYISLVDKNRFRLNVKGENEIDEELKFGEAFNSEFFNFTIYANDFDWDKLQSKDYYFVINDENKLAKLYQSKLKVEPTDKKSSILSLTISGKVKEKEVAFLNQLCDEYLLMDLEEKNEKSDKTLSFVDNQLARVTDSLTITENDLQAFKESNKMMDLSSEGRFVFQKLEELQKEKAKYEVEQNYYDYLIKYFEKNKNSKSLMAPSLRGVGDPSVTNLIIELNKLFTEYKTISKNSSKENPVTEVYGEKIENIRKLIIENIISARNASNIAFNQLKLRIKAVDDKIRKLPVTEKKLIGIQRKFSLNDEIYTFLLQKRAEAGIAKASNMPENKIIDYARVDNAQLISPKHMRNYLIAIILSLLLPLGIIVLLDLLDNKIRERNDVETRTNIPIIAEIGHNNKNTDLVIHKYPRSSISESFRKLRTNLKYSLINTIGDSKVVAVTSTISGEGKSFTSVNMASVLAALDKKVVILGLDLRKPSLHKFFGMENDNGISEYLTKEADYKTIIRSTEVKNLSVILAGTIPPNPAELIELPDMGDLILRLKEDFDYVVLDTPPVALVTDALLLSSLVDINLYVIRLGYSNKSVMDFVNETVEKNKLNMHIILNDIKLNGYYSYRYNYNYKYGGGYYSHNNYYEEDYKVPYFFRLINKFKK